MNRTRAVGGLAAWMAALGAGLVVFHALGAGTLPAPPLQPAAFADWLAATDPTVAAMSVLRLVVLGLSWYLAGATTVGVVARLAGAVRLVRLADLLTVPALRRLLQSALGLSLATAMVAAAAPARAQPLPLQLLEESAGPAEPDADDGAASSRPVPAPLVAEPLEVGAAAARPDAGTRPDVRHHTVVAGESFWRIAADRLAASGEDDDDAAVAMYWRRLIEQNRSRLVDPANPDLLFPGQRLELPPVHG